MTPRKPFSQAVRDDPMQVSAPNHVAKMVPMLSHQPSRLPATM